MRLTVCVLLFFLTSEAQCQFFPPSEYPKGFFRTPLDIPISLAGNFGELRPNHYHMGFDLKTDHRENLPVHAAADGYIAKIKIEPFGFGRAIYINHPNGYTTVYGHLNAFIPALDAYLKQQQYSTESWKVFLDLPPNLFPVKKGDLIAYSGNTGGSQGPHLHFEVRTTTDDVNHNPMLFGFPLEDNTRPSITKLAWYDRRMSVYEQSPKMVLIKGGAGSYETKSPLTIVNSPKIALAISATDTHSGSLNPNGIFEAGLYDNGKPVIGFQMDKISYNNTRGINAHIDYKTRSARGPWLQQLFELPGYINGIYRPLSGDGTIDLSDRAVHELKVVVKDAYGNESSLVGRFQFNGTATLPAIFPGKMFYPLMIDGFESSDCEFYMGEYSLCDSVHIAYKKLSPTSPTAVSAVHSIGGAYIPLLDSMTVRIKPLVDLEAARRNRVVMQRFAGNKSDIQKVEWQKDWAAARFRDLGNFQLLLDETAPVVVPGFKNGANLSRASHIVFHVKDNLESIKNVRAELDGKWIRFTNDKARSFVYIFDEKCSPGHHVLQVSAEDEAGNKGVYSFSFIR